MQNRQTKKRALSTRARADRTDGRERPEKPPLPPPEDFPPSTPRISFHLYGLNWDLTGANAALVQQLRDSIAGQFAPVLPNPSVEIAFTGAFPGATGPIPSLSVGVWSGPAPSSAAARNARVLGLLGARTPGMASQSGEISVDTSLIITTISASIPGRITNADHTVTATERTALVTELAPAGFGITVSYDTDIPILRPQPTCRSNLMFSMTNGSVQASVAPVDCGDFGIAESILMRLDAMGLGLAAVLAFAYVVVSRVGSGLPPIPDLHLHANLGPVASDLLPREVPAGPFKFDLTYGNPHFNGGGAMQRSIRFPFNWMQPTIRQPQVEIRGPLSVTLIADENPPSTTASFAALTTDLVNPTFQWKLGNQTIPGGATAQIVLQAPGLRAPAQRSFHVSVTAVDGMSNPAGPQLQATAEIDVVGTVRHVRAIED